MSPSDPPVGDNIIDDELLSAWVDGELGAEDGARVQAWLSAHPEDMARVQAWAADRAALAAALVGAVQEPVPDTLHAVLRHHEGAPRWALAASAAGLLVLGALLGGATVWRWQSQQSAQALAELQQRLAPGSAEGWVQRAALAHGVYVAEPRHAVEVRAEEEHLARWLTRRIDIPVKLFDLREQGFALVGGRLLPDGPGKSAQLMYQDAQQRRVTVYLRKPESGTDAAFRYEQHGSLGMFYWIEAGAGYALVGDLPKPVLLTLARSIYQQHPDVGAGASPVVPAPPAAPAPADPAASATSRS